MNTAKLLCRIILALVFITASLGKITNIEQFSDIVAAFGILPMVATNLFAVVLPWVELLTGICILTKHFKKEGLILSVILNIVFIAAATFVMTNGINTDCGCFSLLERYSRVDGMVIARDLVLAAMAVFSLIY